MRPTWLVTLVLVVMGATNLARAQEAPTLRVDTKLTDEAMEHARMSPGLQTNTASPMPTLHSRPRHPRRGQRLVRTGGTLLGLGVLGIMLGGVISAALYEPCDDDSYCFDFGPEVGVLASVVMMCPLFVVGVITAGRGARRRARERRLSAHVQLAGGRYGLALMGRF
ncbi:MAG: hypothetical protein IPG81_16250 [Sandaracinaceae bacterium]|nr:hypothetical protein [Sandaracinaceae bacterium]